MRPDHSIIETAQLISSFCLVAEAPTQATTMQSPLFVLVLALVHFSVPAVGQNAAAGGGAQGTLAASQYPTTVMGPSLVTAGGSTVVVTQMFTQTFKSPLGTWAFATPSVGSIGLGNITGSVGAVKNS